MPYFSVITSSSVTITPASAVCVANARGSCRGMTLLVTPLVAEASGLLMIWYPLLGLFYNVGVAVSSITALSPTAGSISL